MFRQIPERMASKHIRSRYLVKLHQLLMIAFFFIAMQMFWSLFPRDKSKSHQGSSGQNQLYLEMGNAEYIAMVKTKTEPPFYISLHREKDDTPRATIMYTGLYYETEKTKQIHALMTMPDDQMRGVFLDIGANIGWFSLYVASMGRHVIAFEPNPFNVQKLQQSIAANQYENLVLLVPFGAGPSASSLEFENRETNMGMGRFVESQDFTSGDVTTLEIKPVDDELTHVPKAWKQRVALVKIDVEGFEGGVLKGMLGTLERDLPLVYVEFMNETPSWDEYTEAVWKFLQLGYRSHGSSLSPSTTLEDLQRWFRDVIHTSPSPKDLLFLPAWIKDEEIPFA